MSGAGSEPVRIDFVADVVCPWCYLGWRAMTKAIALSATPAYIVWRPYRLDPSIPPDGVDRAAYMAARFPDRWRLTQVHETLVELAQALGAPLDLGRIAITPNTIGAHQLIRAAFASGRQDVVVDAVMTAYFAEGRDIGDPEVLCDVGEAHGLSRMSVLEALCDEVGARAVDTEHATVSDAGITGVPFAIFNGLMSVAGAQSPERYGLALRKAASKRAGGGD